MAHQIFSTVNEGNTCVLLIQSDKAEGFDINQKKKNKDGRQTKMSEINIIPPGYLYILLLQNKQLKAEAFLDILGPLSFIRVTSKKIKETVSPKFEANFSPLFSLPSNGYRIICNP